MVVQPPLPFIGLVAVALDEAPSLAHKKPRPPLITRCTGTPVSGCFSSGASVEALADLKALSGNADVGGERFVDVGRHGSDF